VRIAKGAPFVLPLLAFMTEASGQMQVQKQVQTVPVAVTWNYYPQPKSLVLHLVNNSGKDITGFNITTKNKYADGMHDRDGSPHFYDMLRRLVEIQTAKDPAAVVRRDQELGNGIFLAGATRDVVLPEAKEISDTEAVADVVFYADTSFGEQNTDAFKLMLTSRQGQLLTVKKVNGAIENALADKADDHPTAAAEAELTKLSVTSAVEYATFKDGQQYDPEARIQWRLQIEMRNLESYVQSEQKATTERDRLTQYGEYLKKEIEVLTPHCHLEITPSQYGK